MAGRPRATITKRQREQARKERQQRKADRKAQRDAARQPRTGAAPGEDPDLAGIVPGPQPLPRED